MASTMNCLSFEARVVFASFWLRPMNLSELSFKRPHIIGEKLRKGLDDLTDAGLLARTGSKSNGFTWKPTDKMADAQPTNADEHMQLAELVQKHGRDFEMTTE